MPDQPNILYVFADQMRASALGCMGDERVHTPHLDRLASQGVLFRNAIANTPVCTPSRASLITGRHAWTCHCIVNDLRLPEDEISIADALQAHGYRTGYVGKWHLDGISRHMFTPPGRRRHGFDDYWAAYNCHHDYFDCKYYLDDSPELIRETGADKVRPYDADVQTNQAIGFMERFQNDPWCLFLSWGPPHAPYRQVAQEFLDMYPPEEIELRPNAQGADRRDIAGYYAHCTAIDRDMGLLMEALDRLGLAENTILVFSSDHGDMLWSQGRVKKQQPWEESIHIPLIVRWPAALPAGAVNDTLISVADYTPTLLGLAGVPVPPSMNGLDLNAMLMTKDEGRRTKRERTPDRSSSVLRPSSVFINEYVSFDQARAYQPWRGVRTERYTYARWLQGGALLYDNLNDPYQLYNLALEPNLASEPGHKALLEELEGELQGWLERLDDPFLSGDEHIRRLGQWEEWLVRQEHFYGFATTNF
jgi:arylsulfatase A-like enzyme